MDFVVWKRGDRATLYGGEPVNDSDVPLKDYQRDLSPNEIVNGVKVADLPAGFTNVQHESLKALLR